MFETNAQNFRLVLSPHLHQMAAYQRLREAVFAHELGWVPASADGLERDAFDTSSLHVAVSHRWRAAGYLRLTPEGAPWMLNECFDFLLAPESRHAIPANSLEISRLAVAQEYRGVSLLGAYGVFDLLIKGIIEHSLSAGVRYWYVVVAEPIHRLLLSKGLPCERLGPQVRMPDGVQALALRIDLDSFLANAPTFYSAGLAVPPAQRQAGRSGYSAAC